MKLTRTLLVLALAAAPLGIGCSHDDDHHDDHPMAHQGDTSGGSRVHTEDRDHDGTDDTVVAEDDSAPTALDQSEDSSDVEITRQIRAAVVGDSSLSFGARNCVIVTQHGVVTLRGDVTRAERDAIDRHAREVAGVPRADDMLHATGAEAAP